MCYVCKYSLCLPMSEAVPVRYGDRLAPRAGSRVCEVRAGERADWEWLAVRGANRAGLPHYSNGGTLRLIGGASDFRDPTVCMDLQLFRGKG